MTERSKTRRGAHSAEAGGSGKDAPSLRGLERRTRVSRRAAARRKTDSADNVDAVASEGVTASGAGAGSSALTGSHPAKCTEGMSAAHSVVEIARLRAALDRLPNAVAICDNDLMITFANGALVGLLRSSQSRLRKQYPGFDAGQLAGSSLAAFHDTPERLRSQLDATDALPKCISLVLGERRFSVTFSVLQDAGGVRIGMLAEWIPESFDPATR